MLKTTNIIVVLLFVFAVSFAESTTNSVKLINLTEDNFVVLRGQVDELSSSNFIRDILQINTTDIYVYLVTPGGSVTDGYHIIQTINALQGLGKNIICIADFAASMGFSILQSCTTRHVMSSSIIMQHQMSVSMSGPLKNVKARLALVDQLEHNMNIQQANRLNMSVDQFISQVDHDWWLFGENAVNSGAADSLVSVLCTFDIKNNTVILEKHTMFGKISAVFSRCPLIKAPIVMKHDIDNDKMKKYIDSQIMPVLAN